MNRFLWTLGSISMAAIVVAGCSGGGSANTNPPIAPQGQRASNASAAVMTNAMSPAIGTLAAPVRLTVTNSTAAFTATKTTVTYTAAATKLIALPLLFIACTTSGPNPCSPGPGIAYYLQVTDTTANTTALFDAGVLSKAGVMFTADSIPLSLTGGHKYQFAVVYGSNLSTPTPGPLPTVGACTTYAGTAPAILPSGATPAPRLGASADFELDIPSSDQTISCGPANQVYLIGNNGTNALVQTFSAPSLGFSTLPINTTGFGFEGTIGFDSAGAFYYVGEGSTTPPTSALFAVNPSGTVTPLVIPGTAGYTKEANSAIVVSGGDGSAYFIYPNSTGKMGLIGAANGVVKRYAIPAACTDTNVASLVAGPNGTMWFTDNACGLVRFNSKTHSFTAPYSTTTLTNISTIAFGPDGALYIVNGSTSEQITRFDIGSATFTTTYALPVPAGVLTAGPNGALYFGSSSGFGVLTPATGAVSVFTATTAFFSCCNGGFVTESNGDIYSLDGQLSQFTPSSL